MPAIVASRRLDDPGVQIARRQHLDHNGKPPGHGSLRLRNVFRALRSVEQEDFPGLLGPAIRLEVRALGSLEQQDAIAGGLRPGRWSGSE